MARMGVTTVLSAAGAPGELRPAPPSPGGSLLGSGLGALGGSTMGIYLNRRLQPCLLHLGLDIYELEEDDLFYFKNKTRVDRLAVSYRETAGLLANRQTV